MNDVIRLEDLNVAAVALTSNRATDQQIQTLTRFAQQATNNRITLFPDCDEEGEAGFKDLLWKLAECRLNVQLACSSQMFDGRFFGKQPEDFDDDDWIIATLPDDSTYIPLVRAESKRREPWPSHPRGPENATG